MTREEKLQKAHQMFDNRNLFIELKWQRKYFKRGYVSSREELFNLWIFDECIKALEQEPCKDCVSRKFMYELGATCIATRDKNNKLIALGTIENLPPVIPQPKLGKWLKVSNGTLCSICRGYAIDDEGLVILTDYCPWCGAKMVKPQESEDKRCI